MATLIRPCWSVLPPPPPPPPVAVDRLADEHRALPPKLPAASTLACTPQMLAATATGTRTVLFDRSTLTSPFCCAADAGAAQTPSASAPVTTAALSGRSGLRLSMTPPIETASLPAHRGRRPSRTGRALRGTSGESPSHLASK